MNMFNERSCVVDLVGIENAATGILYVKFHHSGVGVDLTVHIGSDGSTNEIAMAHDQTFHSALTKMLLALPPGVVLAIRHNALVRDVTGRVVMAQMTENITLTQGDDWASASYELLVPLGGIEAKASNPEDVFYVFHDLQTQHGLRLICCGTCHYGRTSGFGGDDWRHGLYCFRDTLESYEVVRWDIDAARWAQHSWSNVDCFHWCPSYSPAKMFDDT